MTPQAIFSHLRMPFQSLKYFFTYVMVLTIKKNQYVIFIFQIEAIGNNTIVTMTERRLSYNDYNYYIRRASSTNVPDIYSTVSNNRRPSRRASISKTSDISHSQETTAQQYDGIWLKHVSLACNIILKSLMTCL